MTISDQELAKKSGFSNVDKYRQWVQQVGALIANASVTGFINFQFGSQVINYSGFKKVGEAIKAGRIKVFMETGDFDTYNAISNMFGLRSLDIASTNRRSFIVHEATHAIQDQQKYSITNAEFEAAGYLAQAIYMVRNRVKLTDLTTSSEELSAAMVVVDEWGKNWPKVVSKEDIEFIIDGISKGKSYSNLNKKVPLDGIP